MSFGSVSHRAIAACMTAALILPILPVSAQQMLDDPRYQNYVQARREYMQARREQEQARLRAWEQQRHQGEQWGLDREKQIDDAMRIVHAAFPDDRERSRRAFAIIRRAPDPVREARTFVSSEGPAQAAMTPPVTPVPVARAAVAPALAPATSTSAAATDSDSERKMREALSWSTRSGIAAPVAKPAGVVGAVGATDVNSDDQFRKHQKWIEDQDRKERERVEAEIKENNPGAQPVVTPPPVKAERSVTTPEPADDPAPAPVTTALEVQYSKDLESIDKDQKDEMRDTDFSRVPAQQVLKFMSQLNAKYDERRRELKLAFDEEQKHPTAESADDQVAKWDSPERVKKNADSLDAQAEADRRHWDQVQAAETKRDSKPDALQITAAIVAGVALYAIGKTVRENEEYQKMTPEQKAEFNRAKAENRRQIDEMEQRRAEESREAYERDQMDQNFYKLQYGKDRPY